MRALPCRRPRPSELIATESRELPPSGYPVLSLTPESKGSPSCSAHEGLQVTCRATACGLRAWPAPGNTQLWGLSSTRPGQQLHGSVTPEDRAIVVHERCPQKREGLRNPCLENPPLTHSSALKNTNSSLWEKTSVPCARACVCVFVCERACVRRKWPSKAQEAQLLLWRNPVFCHRFA